MCAVHIKNKKKQKICCFCEQWESGGIESFLANVVLHMDLSEFRIEIVAARLGKSIFTAPLEEAGVVFHELQGSTGSLYQNWRLFLRLLREGNYDVVHLHIFHGLSLFYGLLAKKEGVAVRIAHSHNTALRKSRSRCLKMAVHRISCLMFANAVTHRFACSRQAAEFMFPKWILRKKGFTYIPNGIDTDRFARDDSVRRQIRAGMHLDGRLVIGNVGRLCYQKNQKFLLEVFAAVHKSVSQSTLLLVGEGEDRQLLKVQAERAGISDAVLFCGTTDQVEKLYWCMDVFVFPSLFEGLGIAVLEAQASGLPVLCSEHVPEEAFVTDMAKRIFLQRGAEYWADAVLWAAKKGWTAEGQQSVRQAGFDCVPVAEKIRSVYRRDKY